MGDKSIKKEKKKPKAKKTATVPPIIASVVKKPEETK